MALSSAVIREPMWLLTPVAPGTASTAACARFVIRLDERPSTTAPGPGSPPPSGTTGLYHTAIVYPTRRALAFALHHVLDAGIPLDGAADHGVSEALYLRDPDDNGVELYWDRPKEQWPKKPDGSLQMFTHALDLHDLLSELDRAEPQSHS